MKKVLLMVGAFITLSATAQIYEANDSVAFSAWTPYDLDGDGNDWIVTNVNWLTNSQASQGECVTSASWSNAALTPDNLLVSPVMDLSTTAGVSLNFSVGNPEATNNWWEEKYAVYVVNNTAALLTGTFPTPVFETTLTAGDTMFMETIDISAEAAGQATVYVVFRHYDCTDLNFIILDDLSVTGDFAAVEESALTSVTAYPNPATDVLNITTNEPVSSVKVMTMDGKVVIDNNSVNDSFINVNVNDLEAGMYVYEVATAEGKVARETFVKQ